MVVCILVTTTNTYIVNLMCDAYFVCRGTIGVHDMTVGESCSLYLGSAGTTVRTGLIANPGLFYFESLTVAAGGEITSTADLTGTSDEVHLKVWRVVKHCFIDRVIHLISCRVRINVQYV